MGLEALVDQVVEVVYLPLPKGVEILRLLVRHKVMMVEHNLAQMRHQVDMVQVVEEQLPMEVVIHQVKLEVLEHQI